MAAVPQIDIVAAKRVPFDDNFASEGPNHSTAAALMEIRAEPGGQGAPLVSLGMSSSGGQGIVLTYDAAYPDPDGGAAFAATICRIIINETTLEQLAYGADPAASVVLFYDIHLNPVSGKKFVLARGRFVVEPGVTL